MLKVLEKLENDNIWGKRVPFVNNKMIINMNTTNLSLSIIVSVVGKFFLVMFTFVMFFISPSIIPPTPGLMVITSPMPRLTARTVVAR